MSAARALGGLWAAAALVLGMALWGVCGDLELSLCQVAGCALACVGGGETGTGLHKKTDDRRVPRVHGGVQRRGAA